VIDHEENEFVAELRQMTPAPPPESIMARLSASKPCKGRPAALLQGDCATTQWRWLLRWLIPATAVVIVSIALWRGGNNSSPRSSNSASGSSEPMPKAPPALEADEVRIDHELVSSFDAIARLPGGVPVRFRLRKWMDQVVLSDSTQGLIVESSTPRFEVVPVRFETY